MWCDYWFTIWEREGWTVACAFIFVCTISVRMQWDYFYELKHQNAPVLLNHSPRKAVVSLSTCTLWLNTPFAYNTITIFSKSFVTQGGQDSPNSPWCSSLSAIHKNHWEVGSIENWTETCKELPHTKGSACTHLLWSYIEVHLYQEIHVIGGLEKSLSPFLTTFQEKQKNWIFIESCQLLAKKKREKNTVFINFVLHS